MKRGIEQLFRMRNRFIVIGVTGKTGSGCTTVASILSKDRHELGSVDASFGNDKSSIESRKWSIVSRFCKKNWKKFHHIRVKDIISTFILESKFDEAHQYIKTTFDIDISEFKTTYECFFEKNKILNEFLKTDNALLYDAEDPAEIERIKNTRVAIKNYILSEIQQFSDNIKLFLDSRGDKYISVFQKVGDNIRRTGCAFADSAQEFEHIFSIARRINTLIKIIRRVDKSTGELKSLYVIDAFRNPLEVHFFRERFSAFYLMAVNCDEDERRRRLSAADLKESQIVKIDKKESSNEDFYEDYEEYTGQNIKSCINMADLYVNNLRSLNSHYTQLTKTILRYVALIQHPGIVKPTKHEFLMQLAITAATNSGCMSRNVGAVITDSSFEPLAIGWNCVPKLQIPCYARSASSLIDGLDPDAYSDFEKTDLKFSDHMKIVREKLNTIHDYGLSDVYCFKSEYNKTTCKENQVHTRALHAEENTILQCAKHGQHQIENGFLFTSASPCVLCAKKICQMGITEVFYMDPYPDISEKHVFSYGENKVKMTLFTGAIGLAFQKLYIPLIPLKDEVAAILHEV
ncbi:MULTISPECIES: hypothetical protein [unclassified Desulfovibrio]|uniref:hypothetical protein n=1 Tax=unclassified Desulfovibrio TaxID=2593640 RepID=UPI002FDA8CAD